MNVATNRTVGHEGGHECAPDWDNFLGRVAQIKLFPDSANTFIARCGMCRPLSRRCQSACWIAVGERSAILYTVIESCRRHDLDPYAYLREVLSRLPELT